MSNAPQQISETTEGCIYLHGTRSPMLVSIGLKQQDRRVDTNKFEFCVIEIVGHDCSVSICPYAEPRVTEPSDTSSEHSSGDMDGGLEAERQVFEFLLDDCPVDDAP